MLIFIFPQIYFFDNMVEIIYSRNFLGVLKTYEYTMYITLKCSKHLAEVTNKNFNF